MFVLLRVLVAQFPLKLMPVGIRDMCSDMHKTAPVYRCVVSLREDLNSVKASLLLGLCPTSFHTAVQYIKLFSFICGQDQIISV